MNKYAIYCDSLEDEQILKDWIKKESNLKGYDDYTYIKNYFHYPALTSYKFDQNCHIFDCVVSEYTKINIKDFLKEYYKMNKTELLGLPIIKGEQHHLEAFVKDCEKYGYCFNTFSSIDNSTTYIKLGAISNISCPDSPNFKKLYPNGTSYNTGLYSIKEFQLPNQWSEAVDFMKENMDRWNKIQEENKEPEFKVGDWVYAERGKHNDYRKDEHVPIFQIEDINNGTSIWLRAEKGLSNGVSSEYCRKATPEEIEEYNNKPKIFKMTSSSGDFELEVSKKGIYYRPEDSWVDPTSIEKMLLSAIPVYGKFNSRLPLHTYTMEFETVKVGCKSGCSVKAWKEVYDYYKSLQK